MAFRSAEETLRARVLELERENAELRAELARATGKVPLEDAGPDATPIGEPIWSPGSSWLLGWHPPEALLAYTGEADDRDLLRYVRVGGSVLADFALAKDGAKHTLRLPGALIAPLADGSLARFAWPGHAVTTRISLSSPLIAQPMLAPQGLLAVTAARELMTLDPERLLVVERRPVDAPELERLGFRDTDPRQRHNGWELALDTQDGWELKAFRAVQGRNLCALARSFAGNAQLAAGVATSGQRRLAWFREVGAGDFIYLYGIDGMLVLHNVSLEVEPMCWALWQQNGAPVLTVRGRAPRATLDVHDGEGAVIARCLV